ncbi:ABC transporter permease [Streptosporangium sp. CA-115845]|uniref:ABC transporter permease n=1 Tax=Streptosporangium sp. CA-115845 TaxID=3240071 RepID=UPI003D8ADA0E
MTDLVQAEKRARTGQEGGDIVLRRPDLAERDPVRFQRRRVLVDNLLRFGTPVLILAVWQAISSSGLVDQRFWPPPSEIVVSFVELVSSGLVIEAAASTIQVLMLGYLGGSLAGILLGVLLGSIRKLRTAIEPIISALYTVPKLAVLPLLLMVFGLGMTPKVLLVAFGVFFIVVISTMSAVAGIPEGYLEPARSFGASRLQTFRHVTLPAMVPEVFTSLRIAIGTAVLLVIGIEFVQGRDGLGFLIWNSWQVFLADRMYAGIVTVSLIGVALQSSVTWIGRRIAPWAPRR